MNRSLPIVTLLAVSSAIAGCSGRPQLFPNSDKNLQKTSAEFAADAAKRHPYKLDAPRAGEAPARAQVGYSMDVLELTNLSDEEWQNVEVWVNQQYVVFLPKVQPRVLKRMPFQMLFDANGRSFPTDNLRARITKLEVQRDGKIYDVPLQLAD